MRKSIIRASSAALLVASLGFTGVGAASASTTVEPAEATASAVADFEATELPQAPADEAAKYESLTDEQKAELVAVVTSGDLTSHPDIVVEESSDIAMTPSKSNALRGTSRSSQLNYQTYDVTATGSFDYVLFGVSVGYWKQVYKYQTGNNRVLKDYSCRGTFTGFSGALAISPQDTHYVSGGYGHCSTLYVGHLVYKGSTITINKELYQKVAGYGRVEGWLRNV